MMPSPIRVLIVDDHEIVRKGIRALLATKRDIQVVGEARVSTEYGDLNQFDPGTGTFMLYRYNAADPGSLSDDAVFSIYEDHQDRLWIGTEHGGLNRFDPASGSFIYYQHDASDPMSLSDNSNRAIYQDSTRILWICTFARLNRWDDQGSQFTVYRHEPGNPSSLTQDRLPGGQFMPC